MIRSENQISLFDVTPAPKLPPGLSYCPDAITPTQEAELLDHFAGLPFKQFQFHGHEGKRRVVSFGWRYDFNNNRVLPSDPIPPFLLQLFHAVQATTGFRLSGLQQAHVTEYSPGSPIGWHRDRAMFSQILGVSLASACTFRLRKQDGKKWLRASVSLEPRSAYLMEGPVRWEWEHSIPPVESLRYSVTFRNLQPGPLDGFDNQPA